MQRAGRRDARVMEMPVFMKTYKRQRAAYSIEDKRGRTITVARVREDLNVRI